MELITFVLADISVFVAVISFPVHDIAAVLPPGGTWISLHRMFSGSFSSNFACQLPEPQPLTPGDGVGECAGILPLHRRWPPNR